ncbi:MAG: HPr kinase/phosphatase C-terminal domain-containing protein [Paracoccaceae bacterium]
MVRSEVFDKSLHATCVAFKGRGLLITGASGSGKSSLGLQLIAQGADLVADDRVVLTQTKTSIVADAPESIRGLIEARGVGVLNTPSVGPVSLELLVDLDISETERLPPLRVCRIGDHDLPVVHNSNSPRFPAALLLYLEHGRSE